MNKIITVTGATGFVGQKLTLALLRRGYDVRVVSRDTSRARSVLPLPVEFFEWDGVSEFPHAALENAFGVVHLAGENIAGGRWSSERKRNILESRTRSTQSLVKSLSKVSQGPQVLVGTSAIGIYGDQATSSLSEDSSHGKGFLAEVCEKWEQSYQGFNGRLAILRVGVVLGHGGALDKMLLPFRMGVGGPLASGKQWMSWIHIDDLVSMYLHSLENNVSGVFNAVAPDVVTNAQFTNELGNVLHRPTLFPVPGMVIKAMFGEMSQVVLGSQKVTSKKIESSGFSFRFPKLALALGDLLRSGGFQGAHVVEFAQWVPQKRNEVFNFFSQAENLEKITPNWLNFHIKKKSTPEISQGTLIDYKLRIKGVPAKWRTLISLWQPSEKFVDEQLKGPYSLWHHTHGFEDLKNGTLLTDRVLYRAPLGIIGSLVEFIMIRHDVRKIFSHLHQTVESIFPGNSLELR